MEHICNTCCCMLILQLGFFWNHNNVFMYLANKQFYTNTSIQLCCKQTILYNNFYISVF